MKRVTLSGALLIVLLLVVSFTPVHSQEVEDLIPQLAAELNLWRLELGLGPLVYSPTLEAMAASQADYLMSLEDMPLGGDMHIDAEGSDARARSQREPFNWPVYENAQRIALTEIAGVGSIRSAMNFWHNSDLHNRSVTNPTYREIGIAVRSMDNLNGDVLFIVVMGGRPNILTALPDPETGELYLTTELNEWEGDWIGDVTEFRYLDAEHQPVGDWLPWAPIVPMLLDTEETFYIEYRDAEDNRAEATVELPVRWSSFETDEPEEAVVANPTRNSSGLIFATNTPFGASSETVEVEPATATATLPPVASATPTPQPVGVLLQYTNRLFTLIPTSGPVSITELSFRSGDLTFRAQSWESVSQDVNLAAMTANNCLQIWQRDAGDFAAPANCSFVRGVVFLGQAQMFWTLGSFEVLVGDVPIATCQTEEGQCSVVLPEAESQG